MGKDEKAPKKERKLRARLSPWWSLIFGIVLHIIYSFRLDITYAITAWPAWFGASFGILMALLSKKWIGRVLLFWLYFGIVFVVEVKTFPRLLLPEPAHDLRVVSLNCAGGSYEAAAEVKAQNPDIVLYQESCNKHELEKLAHLLFGDEGSFISGPDASIVARGHLEQIKTDKATDFVLATWTDTKGRKLQVMSLRLMPPTMRIDLYDPVAWRAFAENRASRRTEVGRIESDMKRLQPDIVGGDFNCPPDQDVLFPITEVMQDTFAAVGVGYGATCVNPFPCLVRIDQIYCSTRVTPTRSRVVATQNSDHRMLVSDFKHETIEGFKQ